MAESEGRGVGLAVGSGEGLDEFSGCSLSVGCGVELISGVGVGDASGETSGVGVEVDDPSSVEVPDSEGVASSLEGDGVVKLQYQHRILFVSQ